ncbi:MAG TPA: RHS repeat-associated core domain-containing protein [Terriglobales bacterium]|nr:RHS repeat-associated core domain-containing protein [Terriglobales bacterium]
MNTEAAVSTDRFLKYSKRVGFYLAAIVWCAWASAPALMAQGYLSSTGEPSFAVPQPAEMGTVDGLAGNLHLSIPMGSYPQRGGNTFDLKIDYDSHLWSTQPSGLSTAWYPAYYPGYLASGGWRVVAPSTWLFPNIRFHYMGNCGADVLLVEPNGTQHWFNIYDPFISGCNYYPTTTAWAIDSSGIKLVATFPSNLQTYEFTAYAPDGTMLIQQTTNVSSGSGTLNPNAPEDSNGNYWTLAGFQGVGQDTTGRVPLQTPSGTGCSFASSTGATYYGCFDVSTSQGTSRYTITWADISLKTNFQQSGTSECTTNCITTVIRNIVLPDGTNYSFQYDCDSSTGNAACNSSGGQSAYYGTLTKMTLPTGDTITYGYTNFKDFNGAVSRWLTSKSSSKGYWSYNPTGIYGLSTSNPCAPGYNVSCLQTAVYRPDGSSEIIGWLLDAAGGAQAYQIRDFDRDGATLLSTVNNTWDLTHMCTLGDCNGKGFQNVHLLKKTTTVPIPGGNLTKQITYAYDAPTDANITALKEWKYQSGTAPGFPSVPERATYYTYAALANNNINKPLTITVCNNSGSDSNCPGGGSTVARTVITYDAYGGNGSLSLQSVTGVVNHDDAAYGSSYASRGNATQVSQWVAASTYLSTAVSYDTTGQIVQINDPAGIATAFQYADNFYQDNGADPPAVYSPNKPSHAYVTQVTDAIGTSSMGYYFGSGHGAIATDYNGVSTYAHFLDTLDRPTQTDYPIGWDLTRYTLANQIDSYSPVADATASPSCTSCAHVQAMMDTEGRTTSEYLVNNPTGQVISNRTYDGADRLVSASHPNFGSSDPNAVNESFTYDGMGRVLSILHPDGGSAHLAYGANVGSLGGIASQLSSAATYGYGVPVVSIDEAGKQRQEWLDGFGHVIEVDEPSSTTATPGKGSVSINFNSGEVSYTFDPCSLSGHGSCPQTVYNSGSISLTIAGCTVSTSWGPPPPTGPFTVQYVASQLASSISSSSCPITASANGGSVNLTSTAVGANSNLSFTTSSTYNNGTCYNSPCFSGPAFYASPTSGGLTGGSGGLTSSTAWVTTYTYDALGNLLTVNQGVQTRTYHYDGLSRLTQEITPEAGTMSLSYVNSSGGLCSGDPTRPCTKTDGRGLVTTYSYDSANRLLSKTHTGTTGPITYSYGTSAAAFNIGRLAKMNDSTGWEAYTYDRMGRVTKLAKIIGSTTFNISYSFNPGGELTSITYPSGRVVQYSYDNVGHLCVVAQSATGCSSYSSPYLTVASSGYDAASRPLSATYGNGVVASISYSPQTTELTGLTYSKGSSTLFGLQFYYQQDSSHCPNGSNGNNGQIQCILDGVQSGRSISYAYDLLGRLINASTTGSSSYPAWGVSETYDRYSNRTNQTVIAGSGYGLSLTVDPATNRISGNTYDGSGDLLNEPAPLSTGYGYSAEGCLTNYTGNGSSAVYHCDGNHFRTTKVVTGNNAITTWYIRSAGEVIAEYDNGATVNSPTREYVFATNRIATITGSTAGAGGTITYEHRDNLAPRLFTDANGNDIGEQGTYPFGEPWYNNSNGSKWIFTTYERDPESGNDSALVRLYESSTGRFLSPDPLEGSVGDPQSWNRYAYVENDPINLTDASGKGFWSDLLFAITDVFIAIFDPPALGPALSFEADAAAAQEMEQRIKEIIAAGNVVILAKRGANTTVIVSVPSGTGTECTGEVCNATPSQNGSDSTTSDSNGGPGAQGPGRVDAPEPTAGGSAGGAGGDWPSAGGSIWDECGTKCTGALAWASNFTAGAGDALTFGLTKVARKGVSWVAHMGYGDNVNYSSGTYWEGFGTGTVLGAVLGKANPVIGIKGFLPRWWPLRGGLYNSNNFLRIGFGPVPAELSPVTGRALYSGGNYAFRIAVGAKSLGWVRHLDLFGWPFAW